MTHSKPVMFRTRTFALGCSALATAAVVALLSFGLVAATTGSHAGGGGGADYSPTHSNNPGHILVSVLSPKQGSVTSGGRYHDRCVDTNYDGKTDVCYPADGGNWSMDVGGTGGLYLYTDWIAPSSGYTVWPDYSRPVSVYAYVGYRGNWSGSEAACY